ncbi:hypothetical protein NC653_041317 [Populus alba x Populus x berolinensis]|uniref:Uncharacterized protein n=1 Tax=Populus alba x Populus x berolinensis TaxID=444605 RepID=A0AAD6PNV1_9ROSI|nr:hypothetical protein NC653_041317 [Populus alba x Populus x berolinensis]
MPQLHICCFPIHTLNPIATSSSWLMTRIVLFQTRSKFVKVHIRAEEVIRNQIQFIGRTNLPFCLSLFNLEEEEKRELEERRRRRIVGCLLLLVRACSVTLASGEECSCSKVLSSSKNIGIQREALAMTNEPRNLLPLSIKGRVDEWVKDLVLENKHNLKQLIVLMWDQVSSLPPVVQFPWSHPNSGLPGALIASLIRSRKNLIFPAAAAAAEYYLPKLRSTRTKKRNRKPHNLLFSFHLLLLKHQKPYELAFKFLCAKNSRTKHN